jgi:hemerythrin
MRSASIQEIKQELASLKPAGLTTLCLRLARFKKENKELLTYLLFEAQDEQSYIRGIKQEIEELFTTINLSHLYFAKKTLRKIVRVINKFVRYSGNKQTDIELRIYFCQLLKNSGIPIRRNAVISNLYDSQLKKINILLSELHEDLQYDYAKEIELLAEEESKGLTGIFRKLRK